MFQKWIQTIVLLTCLTLSGCQWFNPIGPIVQIGVYWFEGEAQKYYNIDDITVRKGVLSVLEKLELPVTKQRTYKDCYYITAGDKDRFSIKIRSVRQNITKVSIRVNTFGDKPFAELIYRKLDQESTIKQFVSVKELNTAIEKRQRRHR